MHQKSLSTNPIGHTPQEAEFEGRGIHEVKLKEMEQVMTFWEIKCLFPWFVKPFNCMSFCKAINHLSCIINFKLQAFWNNFSL